MTAALMQELQEPRKDIGDSMQETGDSMDQLGNSMDQLGNSMDQLGDSMDQLGDSMDQLGDSMDWKQNSIERKRGSTVQLEQNSLMSTLDTMMQLSARQAAGGKLPGDFQSVLLTGLPSLMSYLEYLKRSSCSLFILRCLETPEQRQDRVLAGLSEPVSGASIQTIRSNRISIGMIN